MTVTATSYAPLTYNGNGSISVFNITFQFYEIAVIHIDSFGSETEWSENTHYKVTGGKGSTGFVTVITTLPAAGEQVRIERRTSKDQPRDYDLDNEVLENALQQSDDRLSMIMQELDYGNRRRPAISIPNFISQIEFPAPSASKALGWNSAGTALQNIALVDLNGEPISTLGTVSTLSNEDLFVLYDVSAGLNVAISKGDLEDALETTPADGSVTTAKLASAAVEGSHIADDAIISQHLADNAVTTQSITDRAVTEEKLAEGLELGGPSLGERSVVRYNNLVIKSDIVMWEGNRVITVVGTQDTVSVGTNSGFAAGDIVYIETTGTMPGGLSEGTRYYLRDVTATTSKLALSGGGSVVNISDTGSGTHTLYKPINAMTVGPIEIADGTTITIKDGSTWSVV